MTHRINRRSLVARTRAICVRLRAPPWWWRSDWVSLWYLLGSDASSFRKNVSLVKKLENWGGHVVWAGDSGTIIKFGCSQSDSEKPTVQNLEILQTRTWCEPILTNSMAVWLRGYCARFLISVLRVRFLSDALFFSTFFDQNYKSILLITLFMIN